MRAQELLKILNTPPWRPLWFHFTGGERIEIRHPESVIVFRETFLVAHRKTPREAADDFAFYNLLHLVKVVPVNGNGRSKRKR